MKDKMNTTTFRKWLESKLDPEWRADEWPRHLDVVDDVRQFDYREVLREFDRRFEGPHLGLWKGPIKEVGWTEHLDAGAEDDIS